MVGSLALIAATTVLDVANLPVPVAAAVVAAVAGASSLKAAVPAAGSLGVIAFALFNGFVEDSAGTLDVHGRPDVMRLGLFVLAPVVIAAASRVKLR